MIRYWQHTEPSDDWESFRLQLAQAVWMEERFFTTLARMIHGKGGR